MGVEGCCHLILAWHARHVNSRESCFKSPPLICRYGVLFYLEASSGPAIAAALVATAGKVLTDLPLFFLLYVELKD